MLDKDDFEARIESARPLFFQIYQAFEELNKVDVRFIPTYRELAAVETYKSICNLLNNVDFFNGFQGDRYKANKTLLFIATEITIFCVYGPRQAETAWNDIVASERRRFEESKEG